MLAAEKDDDDAKRLAAELPEGRPPPQSGLRKALQVQYRGLICVRVPIWTPP